MESSPCKVCTDRVIGCHDKCEKFQGWKQRQMVIVENKRRENFRNAPSMQAMKAHRNWVKNHR